MAVERYIAAAGLGLFVMFAAELVTLYSYMQADPGSQSAFLLEPDPKLLQFISIGAAPACIMSGVSFLMSRRYGSRQIGAMIAAGGGAMLAGMLYCALLFQDARPEYETVATEIAPFVFMAASVPVMLVGLLLFRTRLPTARAEYV